MPFSNFIRHGILGQARDIFMAQYAAVATVQYSDYSLRDVFMDLRGCCLLDYKPSGVQIVSYIFWFSISCVASIVNIQVDSRSHLSVILYAYIIF